VTSALTGRRAATLLITIDRPAVKNALDLEVAEGIATAQKPVIEGRGLAGFAEAPPAKPLIAAVDGYALAGGFEVALACDLIVASRTATFGLPEVRRGLLAAGGGLVRLPRLLPPGSPPRSSSPAIS
jgi:enoyl-CoA hydratase